MEISGEGLDDILIELYRRLLDQGARNKGSRGETIEMLGVALRIAKPRARLSRSENRGKPFSALGEFFWYLTQSNRLDFIEPYIPDYRKEAVDGVVPGGYGPRLFAMRNGIDQVDSVIRLLRYKPSSKRAVIQLFNAEDIALDYPADLGTPFHHPETPCTISLQFHLRDGSLHMSVNMRSNDAVLGLPHDVFCFSMLQEMTARRLGVELGEYLHYVGSMHFYDDRHETLLEYLDEGYQRTFEMPEMPKGDPFEHVDALVAAEGRVRLKERVVAGELLPEPYWADILRMMQVFWSSGDEARLDELKAELQEPAYRAYIEGRRGARLKEPSPREPVDARRKPE
ncbi:MULTISPECIES: thymidylate synthase [Methylobacteriaceae]|uniref:thymidylate synthase n=1 Tax=Methylobacterium sp. B4 TaxID=1938755 RepID=UPI000D75781A|nr:thymidylate synthase [Methylobacterium sp. B4]PXW60513.1 thymidylate synthase [Methylobacterium sp. B4]